MAMGARKAFGELAGAQEREHRLKVPFTGCDGVTKTGQEWVRRGLFDGDGSVATDCGTGSRNIGKDDPNRFGPA